MVRYDDDTTLFCTMDNNVNEDVVPTIMETTSDVFVMDVKFKHKFW